MENPESNSNMAEIPQEDVKLVIKHEGNVENEAMDTYNQTLRDSASFLEKIDAYYETNGSNHSNDLGKLLKQEDQNEVVKNPDDDDDCSTAIIKQESDDQVEESNDLIKPSEDDSKVEHSDSSKFGLVQSGPAKSKCHKCDICGKDFTWPSQLKRHLLIHSGT